MLGPGFSKNPGPVTIFPSQTRFKVLAVLHLLSSTRNRRRFCMLRPGQVGLVRRTELSGLAWMLLEPDSLVRRTELSGPAWMLLEPDSLVRRTELSGPAWMLLEPYSLVRRTDLSGPAWMLLEPYSQVPHPTILESRMQARYLLVQAAP